MKKILFYYIRESGGGAGDFGETFGISMAYSGRNLASFPAE